MHTLTYVYSTSLLLTIIDAHSRKNKKKKKHTLFLSGCTASALHMEPQVQVCIYQLVQMVIIFHTCGKLLVARITGL